MPWVMKLLFAKLVLHYNGYCMKTVKLMYSFFYPAFYVDSYWGTTTTTTIFIAAAITDWLDGYLARKVCNFSLELHYRCFTLNIQLYSLLLLIKDKCSVAFQMRLGTTFGAFLDPVADKVGLSLLINFN